ncbi:mitochondrial 2-methylisocitrate lyase [Marasmius sp. AFHP31]|nr:mitochondrial 2-methylisocitrate lyase [Marasmius sp. AFHP31]
MRLGQILAGRDHPYTTVPNQVHRIFVHDKKHYDERVPATPEQREKMEYVDYLRPIIADAGTGHGGLSISAVMKAHPLSTSNTNYRYLARKVQLTFVLQFSKVDSKGSRETDIPPTRPPAEFAARYKEDGMLDYVQLVQRKEKEIGCDVLTHQKWSGANYVDKILQSVSSGSSSTSAGGLVGVVCADRCGVCVGVA